MRDYGELTLGPSVWRKECDPKTGRFVTGCTPFTKFKKWGDYASEEAQANMRKGWKNLETHRPTKRPDTADRCRKPIVAFMPDGSIVHYAYIKEAAKSLGINSNDISRCCRQNAAQHVNKNNGKVNTNHRYKGIGFYFRSDTTWIEKKYRKD